MTKLELCIATPAENGNAYLVMNVYTPIAIGGSIELPNVKVSDTTGGDSSKEDDNKIIAASNYQANQLVRLFP